MNTIKVPVIIKPIEVPQVVYKDVEQIKYVTREELTTKYVATPEETIKYVMKEQETVKYRIIEESTIKYVPKEVITEVQKIVEKAVLKHVEVEVVTAKDVALIKEFTATMPGMLESLTKSLSGITALIDVLEKKLSKASVLTIKETLVEVPRLIYKDVEVENIIYKG